MALRFLLGLFEAAFGPGVPYLMSFFYRRNELGLRCGLYASAAPLASTFAGALAYGITSGHPLLTSWRLLFLVEGAPTLVGAVLAWFYLPDGPASANFLTAEEKEVACIRSLRRGGEADRVDGIDWKDLGMTLLDAKPWLTAVRPLLSPTNVIALTKPVYVLQLQRQLLFPPRLPPHNPPRHGLYLHPRPRPHRTTLLPRFSRDDSQHLAGRPFPATRSDDHLPLNNRRSRLRPPRNMHRSRCPLSRRFPRCCGCFPLHW